MFRVAVLDTNIYIDWINRGLHEAVAVGPGYVRFLSSVVLMELRAGARAGRATRALDRIVRAHEAGNRLAVPSATVFDETGSVLARLARRGIETRRASLVNDVLIALTCRSIGATLYTANGKDFETIRSVRPFRLEVLASP